ncbi:MAG TPA: rifamycin-inactivating phosphotransferase [Natronosporangium sp.]
MAAAGRYVVDLREVDQTQIGLVGGKAARLGELSRIAGVRVPAGFCVTTEVFRRILAEAPSMTDRLDRLSRLGPDDRPAVATLSAEIRQVIEAVPIPDEIAAMVGRALARLGEQAGYAVRSSATAEDLPTAAFAGQQDTYLNVVGPAAVLAQIRRCWASLFTDRAVSYRQRAGIDHRAVQLAVVVQQMVAAAAAGVLFTADPVTGNRKVSAVEASFGLADALVSGRANPDRYQVRDGAVIARTVAAKPRAVYIRPDGGTRGVAVEPARQTQPALTDPQVVRLAELGRRIEAEFGQPQDIEWCLDGDGFAIVQSRPITTLFPIPEVGDDGNHVYLSVGHGQMMTDPMRPLGLSVWQLTAMAPMLEAGGRLWVDVTPHLASPARRAGFLALVERTDPLAKDALATVCARDGFLPTLPDAGPVSRPLPAGPPNPIANDPAIVTDLIARSQHSIEALRRDIRDKSGPALFEFLASAFQEHKQLLSDPLNFQAVMAGMEASWWLNDHLLEWLGEKNPADPLTLSAPNNVTSEMGLALLDVADAIRPHPAVVSFLHRVQEHGFPDDTFLDELAKVDGGPEARAAIDAYLDRYGMRCVGEIDITRPRWRERPTTLVPLILDNVRRFEPGAAARRFEQGRQAAQAKETELLARLRELPDGEQKAEQTKWMIDRVRTFIGYREYPKYDIVSRYLIYKQALLAEAERLVRAGVLAEPTDSFYLRFEEFHDAVRTNRVDRELIRQRKEAFRSYHALTPPRVLTSEGELLNGAYRRDDVPAGALVGVSAAPGVVEGRARVIQDLAEADLDAGDILVTTHTDPSWTPVFVAVAGLVTEVGGAMTHGAVIAREYGLPTVVGVVDATRLIQDGQRIRVHATDGYVEVLT